MRITLLLPICLGLWSCAALPGPPGVDLSPGDYTLDMTLRFESGAGPGRRVTQAVLSRDGARVRLSNYDPSVAPMNGTLEGARFRIEHREDTGRALFDGILLSTGEVHGAVEGQVTGIGPFTGTFVLSPVPEFAPQQRVSWIEVYDIADSDHDDFKDKASKVAQSLRTQPGCVAHRVLEALSRTGTYEFVVVSSWESRDDMKAALASDAYRQAAIGMVYPGNANIYQDLPDRPSGKPPFWRPR